MKADNRDSSESTQQNDFNIRETADTVNGAIDIVDNAKTTVKLAQGLSAGLAVGGVSAGLSGGAGMMAGLAAVGGSAVGGS